MPVSRGRVNKKRSKRIPPPKTKLVATVEKNEDDVFRRFLLEKVLGKEEVDKDPERFNHILRHPKPSGIKFYTK